MDSPPGVNIAGRCKVSATFYKDGRAHYLHLTFNPNTNNPDEQKAIALERIQDKADSQLGKGEWTMNERSFYMACNNGGALQGTRLMPTDGSRYCEVGASGYCNNGDPVSGHGEGASCSEAERSAYRDLDRACDGKGSSLNRGTVLLERCYCDG